MTSTSGESWQGISPRACELWSEGLYPSEFFIVSNALGWITQHRKPADDKLDIQATADAMNVQLSYIDNIHEFSETFDPTAYPRPTITINNARSTDNIKRYLFGHGIGHYFHLIAAELPDRGIYDEGFTEVFCNIFGQEMALPRYALQEITTADEPMIMRIADHYGVQVSDVLLQLMRIGKLPLKLGIDSEFDTHRSPKMAGKLLRRYLCLTCNDRLPSYCDSDVADIPTLRFHEDMSRTVSLSCVRSRSDIVEAP